MSIDPIKIPQNVYIEDRIIGPLTLRQIIICVLGAGFSYVIYSMYSKMYGAVSIPMTIALWMPALIAAAFAFVRVNDLSLFRLCLLMIERLEKPTIRTWTPRRGLTINIKTLAAANTTHDAHIVRNETPNEHMQALSTVLDDPRYHPVAKPVVEENPAQARIVGAFDTLIGPMPTATDTEDAMEIDHPETPTSDAGTSSGPRLMRDISPPPSHL
jgi:hypothetical protein